MRMSLIPAVIAAIAMLTTTAARAVLIISKKPTQNVTCDRGSCSATAADAVLNVKDLNKLLRISDLSLTASSPANDIVFDAAFSWTNTHKLTLNADRSITIKQPVAVQGTGALDLEYGHVTAGSFVVAKKGKIDFWDLNSVLTINSERFILIADVATMAAYVSGSQYVSLAFAKDYDAQVDGIYPGAPATAYFGGTLDGLGHVISNLTIHDTAPSKYDGLISNSYGATFRNIRLANVDIAGANNSSVGGFAGDGEARFQNVSTTGTVAGGEYANVGGLIGSLDGYPYSAIDSSSSAAVIAGGASSYAGGLVGTTYDYGGLISNSHATGKVTGGDAGGLVGSNYGGDILHSYATGAVTSIGSTGGGLVGQNGGNIERSFAIGTVSAEGNADAGGLVGYIGGGKIYQNYATGNVSATDASSIGGFAGENANGDIQNAYANGSVTGGANAYVGGLLGQQDLLLSYSYAIGAVSAGPGSTVGGLVGIDYGRRDISRTYWDMDTSGISDPAEGAGSPANDHGIAGLTTTEFQSDLPKGFVKSIWGQDPQVNNGFPYLRALKPR
ncbi:MAG TPA: GLUG motif-containing protein [Rhizomicrobium sp.]|jgi:hypothetical protein|nr:GLUG motif-containing protein [Rhizomicrobium sp.]